MTKSDPRGLTSGWFEDGAHVFPVRVYYEDTDFSGVVYHASFLRFMERGRSEFLRLSGLRHRTMFDAEPPLVWAVRRIAIDFRKPARVDDALHVRTRVREVGRARLCLFQSIGCGPQELSKAQVDVCIVGPDGRPRRLPDDLREGLGVFLRT